MTVVPYVFARAYTQKLYWSKGRLYLTPRQGPFVIDTRPTWKALPVPVNKRTVHKETKKDGLVVFHAAIFSSSLELLAVLLRKWRIREDIEGPNRRSLESDKCVLRQRGEFNLINQVPNESSVSVRPTNANL